MGDGTDLAGAAGLVQLPDGSWGLPQNAPATPPQAAPAAPAPAATPAQPPAPQAGLDATMARLREQAGVAQPQGDQTVQPAQPQGDVVYGFGPQGQFIGGTTDPVNHPIHGAVTYRKTLAGTVAPQAPQPQPQQQPLPAAAGLVQHPDGTWGLPDVGAGAGAANSPQSQGGQQPAAPQQQPGQQPTPSQSPQDRLAADFPDQEVRSRTWYQDMADEVAGGLGSLTHGMSLGLDEILDPLVPAIQQSLQTGQSFTDAYNDQVMQRRTMRENFENKSPALGTTLETLGSVPATVMMGPLFKAVPAAAPIGERALAMARNAVASAGVGGATAFTMTPGDVNQRLEGAKQGAILGAAMPPAEAAAAGGFNALRRVVNPSSQIPRVVGQAVREDFQGNVPNVRQAPVPSIPLTLPEATGSPEAASALDVLNNLNVPAMKRQQAEQHAAAISALMGQTPGEPALHSTQTALNSQVPDVIATRGSAQATRGVQSASKIINSMEKLLWNKPSLTRPNVSSITAKDYAARVVRTMRREEPGLALAIDDSPDLKRALAQLNQMPEKTALNQLNAISSRLRRIARDPSAAGDVKVVATRLADAVQEGMANAPEIAGRPPASQAELDAAEQRIAADQARARQRLAAQPLAKPPPRPQTLTEYLHENGGLAPHGDLKAMDLDKYGVWRRVKSGKSVMIPLMRKGGLNLDTAREMAVGQKFLPTDADINDLLDALHSEQAGTRVYRQEDEAAAHYWQEADAAANRQAHLHEQALDSVKETADQMGTRLTPVQAEHAIEMLANDPKLHPEQAIMDAVQSDEEKLLQDNANRLAFSPPGDLGGATYQAPLPDMQTLREGMKPNPQLVRDWKAARDFTKRKAEVLGHASFDAILARNARGNEPVVPGTALNKFYDFANGVERPGDIANVSRFLDDIRSDWLKLSNEEKAGTFTPRDIVQAQSQLQNGTRNFLFGKMMDAITNTEADANGSRRVQWKAAVDWLDTNRPMLEHTGLLTPGQLDLLDRFRDTAQMIYAGKQLGRAEGSQTFARAVHPVRFVDALLGPITGRALTAAGAAAVGALMTHILGEIAIGGMIATEMAGHSSSAPVSLLYRVPRQRLLEKMGEAYRNPTIARDLAQRLDNPRAFDPQTVRWLHSLLATDVPGQAARAFSDEPQRQPEMAQ